MERGVTCLWQTPTTKMRQPTQWAHWCWLSQPTGFKTAYLNQFKEVVVAHLCMVFNTALINSLCFYRDIMWGITDPFCSCTVAQFLWHNSFGRKPLSHGGRSLLAAIVEDWARYDKATQCTGSRDVIVVTNAQSYACEKCQVPLHNECFKIYHGQQKRREVWMKKKKWKDNYRWREAVKGQKSLRKREKDNQNDWDIFGKEGQLVQDTMYVYMSVQYYPTGLTIKKHFFTYYSIKFSKIMIDYFMSGKNLRINIELISGKQCFC